MRASMFIWYRGIWIKDLLHGKSFFVVEKLEKIIIQAVWLRRRNRTVIQASRQYPTMADFYELCRKEYDIYAPDVQHIFTLETLHNICLGIYSMCVSAESKFSTDIRTFRIPISLCSEYTDFRILKEFGIQST